MGAGHCPKSTKLMARRTKALAIAWEFLSVMETFMNPIADVTGEMHFTVKTVSSSNSNSIN